MYTFKSNFILELSKGNEIGTKFSLSLVVPLMVDTPEEVVVLLVRGPDLEVEAVWLHRVAALLPLQSLALLLSVHLADILHPGLADPVNSGHLLRVLHHCRLPSDTLRSPPPSLLASLTVCSPPT